MAVREEVYYDENGRKRVRLVEEKKLSFFEMAAAFAAGYEAAGAMNNNKKKN